MFKLSLALEKINKNLDLFIFLGLFIFVLLFYRDVFSHYFYQDDFFHFYISKAENLKDFLNFFSPVNKFDYQVYRPLATQTLFFIYRKLFGLNHNVFQLINLLLLTLNSFLLFKLLKKYTKTVFSLLFTLFYIVHHQNIGIVYYLSTIQISLAVMFLLLGLLTILEAKKYWQTKTIIFYSLSLLCQELAIFTSLIFIIFMILNKKETIHKLKKIIIILLSITVSFVTFRFYFSNKLLFQNTHYYFSFSPMTLFNNLMWYTLWTLSVPEYVISFIGNNFQLLPPLITVFRKKTILSSFILFTNFIIFLIFFIKHKNKKEVFLYLICFLSSLLPVLFFPWHKYVYHLPLSFIFILVILASSIKYFKKNYLIFIMLFFLLIGAITANFIDRQTSPNYKRGGTAAMIKNNFAFEKIANGEKRVLIKNDPTFEVFSKEWGSTSTQAKIILSDQVGLGLMSGNDKLKIFYEDELAHKEVNFDYEFVIKKEW